MSALYRQASCGLCNQPSAKPIECARCRRRVCAGCMRRGACGACLDAALRLVLRNLPPEATDGPRSPTDPSAWVWPLRFAALGLAAATALISAHGVYLARAALTRPTSPPSARAATCPTVPAARPPAEWGQGGYGP